MPASFHKVPRPCRWVGEAAAPTSGAAGDGTGLVCNLDVFLAGRVPPCPHFPKLYSSVSGLKLLREGELSKNTGSRFPLDQRHDLEFTRSTRTEQLLGAESCPPSGHTWRTALC